MKKNENVCFCRCHELGRERCLKCQSLHVSRQKAATNPKDTKNPDIK